MKLSLLVHASPHSRQSASSALHFARAALASGRQISRIFFYGDGVLTAFPRSTEVGDEIDPAAEWSALARDAGIDLVICVAAAQRRALESRELAAGFRLSGLGQLIEAGAEADRLVTFGD